MADTGLTANGLVIETIPDIRAAAESNTRDKFGASLPLGDFTVLGHLLGLVANAVGLLWERFQELDSSQDPEAATGAALRRVCLLTGTLAPSDQPSTTVLTLCGDDGTFVAAGLIAAMASLLPSITAFATDDDVTIALLPAWTPTTSYSIGNRVTNASRCYHCLIGGTSAGSGGPTTTASSITDGGVTWEYLGEGTAAIDVDAACLITGPTFAAAGDVRAIQTPTPGLKSARNRLDASLGQSELVDEDLRVLRTDELAGAGATTRDALRGKILKLTGVQSCTIFTNRGDGVDGNGVPAHSFETLVRGGDPQEIVDTIAADQPDGIGTAGTSTGFSTDSAGNIDTILYSRPTLVLVYVDVTIRYNAVLYPADGNAQVADAIAALGGEFKEGDDVEPSELGAGAFKVPGVRRVDPILAWTDVIATPATWAPTTAYVATAGSASVVTNGGRVYVCVVGGTSAGSGGPTGTGTAIVDGGATWRFLGAPLTMGVRDLAALDTTRIAVHASAITP